MTYKQKMLAKIKERLDAPKPAKHIPRKRNMRCSNCGDAEHNRQRCPIKRRLHILRVA